MDNFVWHWHWTFFSLLTFLMYFTNKNVFFSLKMENNTPLIANNGFEPTIWSFSERVIQPRLLKWLVVFISHFVKEIASLQYTICFPKHRTCNFRHVPKIFELNLIPTIFSNCYKLKYFKINSWYLIPLNEVIVFYQIQSMS